MQQLLPNSSQNFLYHQHYQYWDDLQCIKSKTCTSACEIWIVDTSTIVALTSRFVPCGAVDQSWVPSTFCWKLLIVCPQLLLSSLDPLSRQVRGELLSEYSMTYEVSNCNMRWLGDVTLKDEVCQMLGYVRCKKWNVIDAVGNTHEIRIQQLRAGGKLAITDGLDNIMEFYNLTNSRHLINLRPIRSDTFKIVIYDNGDEIQYQQQYTDTFLHPICKCRWCRSAGQTFQFDCEVEITVNRNQAERSILPLLESFVAAALPLSSGEHYLVDEDNVEHPVELGKREQVDVKKKTDLAFFRIRYEALRH
ncbi:hypothetical protein RIF29_29576 [Crotalaria pallida]|uniref:Uncharacterized protein n=1 Tax=Crotalaria pallida TaxID=3830 RepID=A0AAN9EH57_CROPI